MRAATTSDPRCRPGGLGPSGNFTPILLQSTPRPTPCCLPHHTAGLSKSPERFPRHQHPSSSPKETSSCHCALALPDSLPIPLGHPSALGPGAEQRKARRPPARSQTVENPRRPEKDATGSAESWGLQGLPKCAEEDSRFPAAQTSIHLSSTRCPANRLD